MYLQSAGRILAATLLLSLTSTTGVSLAVEPAAAKTAQGDILYHGRKANRVLFLGNSITLHGPAPAIGWHGNWGMAASDQKKDYAHLVLADIARVAGRTPESMIANVADFERRYETFDIDAGLKRQLDFRAELVIVAIAENTPALAAKKDSEAFRASVERLLRRFQQAGASTIVVRSCFWPEPAKDACLKAACRAVGGVYVEAPLGRDVANHASSERHFDHAGVAGHPGDRGMKALADAIVEALRRGTTPAAKTK